MKLADYQIKRFWANVDVRGGDDCWPWLGKRDKRGYGIFWTTYKLRSHRVSFFLANGYIPNHKKKRMVLHDCENSWCQNPKHLLDGTAKENSSYPNWIAGHVAEKNGANKLTKKQVLEIFKSKEMGKILAKKYGVSPSNIVSIRKQRTWKNITS